MEVYGKKEWKLVRSSITENNRHALTYELARDDPRTKDVSHDTPARDCNVRSWLDGLITSQAFE